ncbi:hypothetical protein [Mycoplasma sp. ATU-Cv-508]|uniref:hypothetical protein n=1 Tax=Mycoplasma sp. ATU-Cv-508 TaxID=2048001 RepID=UPI0031F2F7EA
MLRRPSWSRSLPGDDFLPSLPTLERAAKINPQHGAFDHSFTNHWTQAGDISAYIPTNVISITDGQIFMLTSLFNLGQRPAVDVGYSVSRVGSAAQIRRLSK